MSRGRFVLLLLIGCGDTSQPSTPPPTAVQLPDVTPKWLSDADASTAFPAAGAPASVQVLNEGVIPRHLLRWRPPTGAAQRVQVESQTTIATPQGSVSIPQHMEMDVAVEATQANGDFDLTGQFVVMRTDDPALAPRIQPQLDKVVGLRFSQRISQSGVPVHYSLTPPPDMDPALVESMRTSMQRLSVVVPAQPLGAGATYRVLETLAAPMLVQQEMFFAVDSVGESSARLTYHVRYRAPVQLISGAKLTSLTGSGHGEVTLNFTRPTPARATVNTDLQMDFSGAKMRNQQSIVLNAISL